MARSHIVFLTLVLSVVSTLSTEVPVFLWGDLPKTSLKSNPLSTVSASEFGTILKQELLNDPFTVIFVEENLSVEDFSRRDLELGGDTSYPYLHANLPDSYYLPSVEDPIKVLNSLADPEKVSHVILTENGLSADIESDSGRFLFINMNDAREGESRASLLRRHNNFLENTITKLQDRYNSVIAVYTAHYPSWTVPESHSRVRRQAQPGSPNDFILDGLRFYVNAIQVTNANSVKNLTTLTNSSSIFENTNGTSMTTTLDFLNENTKITLNFKSASGYWSLDSVLLDADNVKTNLISGDGFNTEVYALTNFSYRCADNVAFRHRNDTKLGVNFLNLKIQPFFATLNASDMNYGDSFNCSGFFSAPIWSGLFVVFILLIITFYGIMNMMDIRTMDRFDDPKGKTITVNALE
ncbi:V-type proton ATPase subunit S1 [Achroia grisella]|uniref:V-type proton ATPase subunit S1 n=1 Tax=Achroia grisella TaxID=688607 RepID=UPI0027D20BFB|nr:V-type proton ATPase subunit S1 [Achroia grisella]